MKRRGSCLMACGMLMILLAALGILSTGAYLLGERRQAEARADFAPPAVLITDPAPGAEVAAGSHLVVSGSAVGARPIVRVELWMDGALEEAQESDRSGGLSPFYIDFDLLIPSEGPHLLFVRAVDDANNVGQSAALSLTGIVKPVEILQAVPVQEGDTLEGIAAANGIGPGVLENLNPDLTGPLAPGSVVKVPAPADAQPEAKPTDTPPAPSGNTSVQIPDVVMLQIASERSTGLTSIGTFIPEPFAGNLSPPAAPTGLQVEVQKCKIIVRWDDNADDEENYYVYMVPVTYSGFSVPAAYLKPSPGTGPAWHELETKASGSYAIWVDAANSFGTRSSDTVWVYVEYEAGCPATTAAYLDVKFLDMTTAADFDKAYCYVSLEKAPEQRIPMSGDFVGLQAGKSMPVPSASWAFLVPQPKDQQLDLAGECWAWSGDQLKMLDSFSAAFAPDAWLGNRQVIKRSAFEIGLSIEAHVPWGGPQPAPALDPTLPVPYGLVEEPPPPQNQGAVPPMVTLRWKWDGDLAQIDAFEVYLNGKPYLSAGSHLKQLETVVGPGAECGQMVRWQVAARVGTARSGLSAPLDHPLPPCQAYLRVRFDSIFFHKTDDGWPGDQCDTLDGYFQLSVQGATRSFWNSNFVFPFKCKWYKFGGEIPEAPFLALYGSDPFVFTIPLSPGEDPSAFWIKARFWDSDSWNPDDLVAQFSEHPMGAYVPEQGQRWTPSGTVSGCASVYTTGASITDEARSVLTFSYTIYPNECGDIPPAEGF